MKFQRALFLLILTFAALGCSTFDSRRDLGGERLLTPASKIPEVAVTSADALSEQATVAQAGKSVVPSLSGDQAQSQRPQDAGPGHSSSVGPAKATSTKVSKTIPGATASRAPS